MLMNHGDASRHGVARTMAGERSAAEHNGAGIGRKHPEQDLHQGALAGTILPEQAEDLAGLHVEIDAVISAERAEAANDPTHLQEWFHPLPAPGKERLRGSGTAHFRFQAQPLATRPPLATGDAATRNGWMVGTDAMTKNIMARLRVPRFYT
jgi:hypothetical protein